MNLLEQQNAILYYQSQENVNADNLNYFYNATFQNLTSYFQNYSLYNNTNANQVGSICNGIGVLQANSILSNNFGQTGTSNIFTFKEGMIRFIDQLVTYPATGSGTVSTLQDIYAFWNGNIVGSSRVYTLEITTPTTDGTTYYVVAVLTLTANTAYQLPTVQINTVAISLADLQANQSSDNPNYVALFNITASDEANYTVGIDQYCANNYNIYTYSYISSQLQSVMPYGSLIKSKSGSGTLTITNQLSTSSGTTIVATGYYTYRTYESQNVIFVIKLNTNSYSGSNSFTTINLYELLTSLNLPTTSNTLPKLLYSMSSMDDPESSTSSSLVIANSGDGSIPPSEYTDCPLVNTDDLTLPIYTITNSTLPFLLFLGGDASGITAGYMSFTLELILTNNP